jgi:hypothetical protein
MGVGPTLSVLRLLRVLRTACQGALLAALVLCDDGWMEEVLLDVEEEEELRWGDEEGAFLLRVYGLLIFRLPFARLGSLGL